jgi:hypothetical protein
MDRVLLPHFQTNAIRTHYTKYLVVLTVWLLNLTTLFVALRKLCSFSTTPVYWINITYFKKKTSVFVLLTKLCGFSTTELCLWVELFLLKRFCFVNKVVGLQYDKTLFMSGIVFVQVFFCFVNKVVGLQYVKTLFMSGIVFVKEILFC